MTTPAIRRIALVTDFGAGPYVGQVLLRLQALLPGVPAFDLVSDLPPFRPDLAAYLLPALVRDCPPETLFLCVVDPGVGGARAALALAVDGHWFVGPDNGLVAPLARRARDLRVERVDWRPTWSSDSFHGRDLFAPVAARLCLGQDLATVPLAADALVGWGGPADLAKVVYVDRYGNLVTGWRAAGIDHGARLRVGTRRLAHARTFGEVPPGEGFWYENGFGLVEVAVNQGRADLALGLVAGDDLGPPLV